MTGSKTAAVKSVFDDETMAAELERILSNPLGPKALDVQTKHIASTAREYPIVDASNRVLLFWRGPGVRYGNVWHVSGTTVNLAKLKRTVGITPFEFVRRKYKLEQVGLSDPVFADFVEVPEGNGSDQCNYGEVWTQLFYVQYLGGTIPPNADWFPIDRPPKELMEYHTTLLLPRLRNYLKRQR